MADPVEWKRCERVDGDPVWRAIVGDDVLLDVRVPQAEWFWEWSIYHPEEGDLARGVVFIEEEDDEPWDYQGVEIAQRRCEAVVWALLGVLQEGGENEG